MKNFIEAGIKKAGSAKELALILGVQATSVTNAKAGQRGLPVAACFRLAELVDVDAKEVIAASELATEKDESKRNLLKRYAGHGVAAMSGVIFGVAVAAAPAPVQADELSEVYIMLNAALVLLGPIGLAYLLREIWPKT